MSGALKGAWVCVDCNHVGLADKTNSGCIMVGWRIFIIGSFVSSVLIFPVYPISILGVVFWGIIGLVFWYPSSLVCEVCGSENLIPSNSPKGSSIIHSLPQSSVMNMEDRVDGFRRGQRKMMVSFVFCSLIALAAVGFLIWSSHNTSP